MPDGIAWIRLDVEECVVSGGIDRQSGFREVRLLPLDNRFNDLFELRREPLGPGETAR